MVDSGKRLVESSKKAVDSSKDRPYQYFSSVGGSALKFGVSDAVPRQRIEKKDLLIISHLRQNAREQLTRISRKTMIPVSTICDRLKMQESSIITKHASLVDFKALGYGLVAHVLLRCQKESRDQLKVFLVKHPNINNLSRVNNGFDFMIEGVFHGITHLEAFLDELDGFGILEKRVNYVIEEIKRESFMSNPEFVNAVLSGMI